MSAFLHTSNHYDNALGSGQAAGGHRAPRLVGHPGLNTSGFILVWAYITYWSTAAAFPACSKSIAVLYRKILGFIYIWVLPGTVKSLVIFAAS